MAKVPTDFRVKLAKESTKKQVKLKKAAQKKLKKQFIVDSRVGVIPEKIWKSRKVA